MYSIGSFHFSSNCIDDSGGNDAIVWNAQNADGQKALSKFVYVCVSERDCVACVHAIHVCVCVRHRIELFSVSLAIEQPINLPTSDNLTNDAKQTN